MKLQQKTLEKLRNLINEETEYRSGPKLVDFFNDLGANDTYNRGGGFPSRWMYTDEKLSKINGTPELDKCIRKLFAPVNFIGRFAELDKFIADFNQYLAFDGWQVCLIQAFSRTNRIYDATKTFGNIVTFRDLELATIDAITLFGDSNTKNVVLEKSYKEYLEGFTDIVTGLERRGYVEVVKELNEKFPNPDGIVKEKDKKEFVKLFGEYLRIENILQNYDEFNHLKALHAIDINNPEAIEEFKKAHFVTDEDIVVMLKIELLNERIVQDYRSTYNDIRDWLRQEKSGKESEESTIDWDDVVFEVDLLKSQEINLDYILELIFEHNKKTKNKADLIDEIRRVIRASVGNRAKESLVVDFINETDLDTLQDKANVIESFFMFAQKKQKEDAQALIREENLNEEAAKRYITSSLKREYASENGTELNALLPKMSPLNPQYLTKKQSVFQKLVKFVEKYKVVGGKL